MNKPIQTSLRNLFLLLAVTLSIGLYGCNRKQPSVKPQSSPNVPYPSSAEGKDALPECFAYDDELRRGRHFLGGEALQSARNAVTLRIKDGSVDVTDGPYAETKEMLGGILLLEARDLNHAIALMSQHPGVKVGPFEIRPSDEETNKLIADRDAASTTRGNMPVRISHRIGIKAPMPEVYEALSTVAGVASWWTREVTGDSKVGGKFQVRFLSADGEQLGSMDIRMALVARHPMT